MTDTIQQSNSQRPLVIVAHASVGSGHRSAAQAVAQAMESLRGVHPALPANAEIQVVDILDYGYIRFNGETTVNLFTGIGRRVYDITWHYVLTGRLLWGGGYAWSPLMFSRFTKMVEQRHPIAIVATHIVAANEAIAARMLTQQAFPVVCVPTDYGTEGLWPHREADLFCAADEMMKSELLPRRVPEEKIMVTGIPVRRGFTQEYDRADVLQSFDLPQDKIVVLVMAGAKYREPYLRFRDVVDKIIPHLSMYPQMHFAFMAGADDEYAARVQREFDAYNITNATVFNYVENIAALMSAADLSVTKSGGLTVTECICAHLPVVLVGESFGQERANTSTVVEIGAAVHVETTEQLIRELDRVDNEPSLLQRMIKKASVIRRPHSADDVAKATLDLVGHVNPLKKRFIRFYWGKKPIRKR